MIIILQSFIGLAQSLCKQNPLFSQQYYKDWKKLLPQQVRLVLTALQTNQNAQVKPALQFCKNANFNSTCCSAQQFKTLREYIHKQGKKYLNQGPKNCEGFKDVQKNIPKKCIKSVAGPLNRPPPSKRDQKQIQANGTQQEKKGMKGAANGMVGLVRGLMQYMRNFLCVICSGDIDFANIFQSGKIIYSKKSYDEFITNMTGGMQKIREADISCQKALDQTIQNFTDQTKPGCSGQIKVSKQRKSRPKKANRCQTNDTCKTKIQSGFSFGNPQSFASAADISNQAGVSDNSGPARILQNTFSITSQTKGISVTVQDPTTDPDSYAGIKASGLKIFASIFAYILIYSI